MPLSPRSLRCAALALVLCATSLQPACAQTSTPAPASVSPEQTPSSQRRAITIDQVTVSPDGKRLAWVDSGAILFTPFGNLGQIQRIGHLHALGRHLQPGVVTDTEVTHGMRREKSRGRRQQE